MTVTLSIVVTFPAMSNVLGAFYIKWLGGPRMSALWRSSLFIKQYTRKSVLTDIQHASWIILILSHFCFPGWNRPRGHASPMALSISILPSDGQVCKE